ncbi:MAG: ATP synthase F1 subunit epsilon [Candidatus Poribacteria bacterium]
MSESLKLSIYSPERKLIEELVVEEVILPGSEGQVQFLPGHTPMLGTLETGIFTYKTVTGTETRGVVSTGFFEVLENKVAVMAETIELKGEIDVERAKRAQKSAEETLRDAELDEHKFKKYQLKLQRALIRQQLGE